MRSRGAGGEFVAAKRLEFLPAAQRRGYFGPAMSAGNISTARRISHTMGYIEGETAAYGLKPIFL